MKAILMLNEMPDKCVECPLADRDRIVEFCKITGEEIQIIFSTETEVKEIIRNNDCPLIEINDNIAKLIEVAR